MHVQRLLVHQQPHPPLIRETLRRLTGVGCPSKSESIRRSVFKCSSGITPASTNTPYSPGQAWPCKQQRQPFTLCSGDRTNRAHLGENEPVTGLVADIFSCRHREYPICSHPQCTSSITPPTINIPSLTSSPHPHPPTRYHTPSNLRNVNTNVLKPFRALLVNRDMMGL